MKLLLSLLAGSIALLGKAAAWAILLGAPELHVPAGVDRAAVREVDRSLSKLDFDGGVIQVGSSHRSLRFKSPGQDVIKLLPALEAAGYKLEVRFWDKMPAHVGFTMSQIEFKGATLAVTINSKHPKLDLKWLAAYRHQPEPIATAG